MLIGQTIGSPNKGEFFIEKELGCGAMGTVYRATLTMKGRKMAVALKIVSLGLVGNESAMARFDREATILQQLRHPHIVRLYGTGKYRGTPYIAMEFIDGEALDRTLTRRGRMSWEEVFGYGQQLCDALQHAHEKGIIHRDLKPSNLMLSKDGKIKLTDFGIAKDTDVTALTSANSTIGTASYMSPEQCRGSKELTAKSDLYSLGVVFYELITGKKPFYAETTMDMFLKHVNETPVRPSKFVHDLPIWVDNLIMHLMEKEVETRPMDAATVGRMIAEIEAKVQSLQSAGLEVATARKMDRKLNSEAKTDKDDREAARLIKGKKRKKKKAVPLLEQTWVKALGLLALLSLLVGLGLWLAWPPGPEKAFEQVLQSSPEDRMDRLREYLAKFATSDHPKLAEARALFKELRTKEVEASFVKRMGSVNGSFKRRKAGEGEDQKVMDTIWAALEAERDGNLKKAAEAWAYVKAEIPEPDVGKYPENDAMLVPPYRWAAERHLSEIKAVTVELQRLNGEYDKAMADERLPTTGPEALALKAMRYERLDDGPYARDCWSELGKSVADDDTKLHWKLLATERQVSNTNETVSPEEAMKNRKKLLARKLESVQKTWQAVKDNPQQLLEFREIRNDCRMLIDLYKGEPDPAIVAVVSQAESILKDAQPR